MAHGKKYGGRVAGTPNKPKGGRSSVYDQMKWAWDNQGTSDEELAKQNPSPGKKVCLEELRANPKAFRKELLALDVKFTGKGEQAAAGPSGQDGQPAKLPPDAGTQRVLAIIDDLLDNANQEGKYAPSGAPASEATAG